MSDTPALRLRLAVIVKSVRKERSRMGFLARPAGLGRPAYVILSERSNGLWQTSRKTRQFEASIGFVRVSKFCIHSLRRAWQGTTVAGEFLPAGIWDLFPDT